MENKSRSLELLDKVYNRLDSIDLSTLSMRELSDFLEVVQKGRFLEAYGAIGAVSPYDSWGSGQCCTTNATEGTKTE